jgi:hypothetical protein
MKGAKMNIEFQYLYRDWGNFKNFGSLVFGNRSRLATDEIRRRVERAINCDHAFVASRLKVPELFFRDIPYNPEFDHGFHEFFDALETDLTPNDPTDRDILDLLAALEMQGAAV